MNTISEGDFVSQTISARFLLTEVMANAIVVDLVIVEETTLRVMKANGLQFNSLAR